MRSLHWSKKYLETLPPREPNAEAMTKFIERDGSRPFFFWLRAVFDPELRPKGKLMAESISHSKATRSNIEVKLLANGKPVEGGPT